jgi:KTSC domain
VRDAAILRSPVAVETQTSRRMSTGSASPRTLRVFLGVVSGFVCCMPAVHSETTSIQRTAVESSSIASVGYARESKTLEIEFRSGSIYQYREVPEAVFKAFSAAQSKGQFFSRQIRGKYFHVKLRGPKP